MALFQAWKARAAARKRKEALLRARGLAGTPAAALPEGIDEFSAPEGPFGRLDVMLAEGQCKRPAEVQSLPA